MRNDWEMTENWLRNDWEMTEKWLRNDWEMTEKWLRNDPEMTQRWPRNDTEMTQKWPRNDPEMTRKWQEWRWNLFHEHQWPISPVFICHSWAFINWDFLMQSYPINLGYGLFLFHPIPLICSEWQSFSCSSHTIIALERKARAYPKRFT